MENTAELNVATCPTCGALIDVQEQEPYAKIHCSSCGTWMRVRQIFANYEINGVMGEGGQGMVYRAVDKKLNRAVAIKLMKRQYSADPIFVKRFQSEAKVTAGLNHPNIVKVFSFGEDRGLLYLAMEVVEQGSLDALMAQITKVPEGRVLDVGIQIAKGLQAGLEKGLIHRDIKPGNILFADEHTAKIVDFGLAVLVEKQHEEEGDVWATPFYVAPEKLDGKPEDFRSDMYSLAATLFHAIAGRPPFIVETNSMADLKKIKSKPVHLLTYAPHASNATAYVLDKALAVKPEDRWASYGEFIENLEYARREMHKAPKRLPMIRTAAASASGGNWITIAAVVAVLAGGLFFFLKGRGNANGGTGATPTPPPSMVKDEGAETRYNQARQDLINGKFRPAASTFRELYADGKLQEPKLSWSAVHEGLAEFLAGRPVPARNAVVQLRKLTPSTLGLDAQLVDFFSRLAKAAGTTETVLAADADKFSRTNYECIGILILGLKSWEAGAHETAVGLFRKFQAAQPEGASSWVLEYRPLVARYLEEHAAFSAIETEMKKLETDPAAAADALKKIPVLKDSLKTPSLVAKLTEMEREFTDKIAAALTNAKAEMDKKMAEQMAAEEQKLTDVKLKVKTLCETYRFRDALLAIQAVEVKLKDHVTDRELLLKRVGWLVEFKDVLIRDLASGYNGPLVRKNGQPLPGGVARANEERLDIRVGAGTAVVTWAELTPQSVLAMAKTFFFKPGLTAEAVSDRQWQAGVFCIFTELYNDSQALMTEAAGAKEEYRIHKARFFGEPEPATEPQPQQPPPVPEKKTDALPATGLEMAKDPLNPNKTKLDDAVIKALRRPPPQ